MLQIKKLFSSDHNMKHNLVNGSRKVDAVCSRLPGNSNTFCKSILPSDSLFQFLKLSSFLQLLRQTLNSLLGPTVVIPIVTWNADREKTKRHFIYKAHQRLRNSSQYKVLLYLTRLGYNLKWSFFWKLPNFVVLGSYVSASLPGFTPIKSSPTTS